MTDDDQNPEDEQDPEVEQQTLADMSEETRREWGALTPDGRELPTPDTLGEEAERRQLAGFFEGEGTILTAVRRNETTRLNHSYLPGCKITHAELGGFAEAEGCIQQGVQMSGNCALGYRQRPAFRIHHTVQQTMREKLQRYADLAGADNVSIHRRSERQNEQPTVCVAVSGQEQVRTLLLKLYPWLGHKKKQARIMLNKIIPLMKQDAHLNKRGFVELMKWKEELDKPKPKGNDDRKYTVEYFEDLWADDLEAQTEIGDWLPDTTGEVPADD